MNGLSDREIDALVAEKLDGWRCVSGVYGAKLATMDEESTSYATRVCPHYSTDFNEALRVLRHQSTTFHSKVFQNLKPEEHGSVWGGTEWVLFECKTPRLLCEAMLEANDD